MKKTIHIACFYRNFKAIDPRMSHTGLGISCLSLCRALKEHGIDCDVVAITGKTPDINEITTWLSKNTEVTHAVVEAIWLNKDQMYQLCKAFPRIHWIVRSHSNWSFLQVEATAIKIIRDLLNLQELVPNLSVAGNSQKFVEATKQAYGKACLYLPNLYWTPTNDFVVRDPHDHKLLKIASFGATRLGKGHTSAAIAALELAKMRGSDLEFYINVDRVEGPPGSEGIIQAIRNILADLPGVKLIEVPWCEWPTFRKIVGSMDLTLQLSSSETFNIVTADSVSQGVPAIVGPSIDWMPLAWQVDIDNPTEVAKIASKTLDDIYASQKALDALQNYLTNATKVWLDYLRGNHPHKQPEANRNWWRQLWF